MTIQPRKSFVALHRKAIDMDYKHLVSEVFTSCGVSLSNIVMFLGCKYF